MAGGSEQVALRLVGGEAGAAVTAQREATPLAPVEGGVGTGPGAGQAADRAQLAGPPHRGPLHQHGVPHLCRPKHFITGAVNTS